MIIPWKFCPNCDYPFHKEVFIGDSWDCPECGESGIREAGEYDKEHRPGSISAEQQLENVAYIVQCLATPIDIRVGRCGGKSYTASKQEIADAALQLAEMVLKHLSGGLEVIPDDDIPF